MSKFSLVFGAVFLIVGLVIGYWSGWNDYKQQDPFKIKYFSLKDENGQLYRLNGALTDMVVECELKLKKKKGIVAFHRRVLPEMENGGFLKKVKPETVLRPIAKKTTPLGTPTLQEDLIDEQRIFLPTRDKVGHFERNDRRGTTCSVQWNQTTMLDDNRAKSITVLSRIFGEKRIDSGSWEWILRDY